MKKETININGKEFTIEELNNIIENSKEKNLDRRKEERFLGLFQGLEMKSDIEKYPNSVFFFRGDKLMLEREKHCLWVSYHGIWKVFQNEFGMGYPEIQTFIKSMVEKHFKMVSMVEKPFKMAEVIPGLRMSIWSNSVEKHFNQK